MSLSQKLLYLLLLCLIISPFLVGAILSPSSGDRADRDFKLPPCSFKALLGIPCPLCGMTTFFTNITRLNFKSAFQANPAGYLLIAWLFSFFPIVLKKLLYKDYYIPKTLSALAFTAFKLTLLLWLFAWGYKTYITWGKYPSLIFGL